MKYVELQKINDNKGKPSSKKSHTHTNLYPSETTGMLICLVTGNSFTVWGSKKNASESREVNLASGRTSCCLCFKRHLWLYLSFSPNVSGSNHVKIIHFWFYTSTICLITLCSLLQSVSNTPLMQTFSKELLFFNNSSSLLYSTIFDKLIILFILKNLHLPIHTTTINSYSFICICKHNLCVCKKKNPTSYHVFLNADLSCLSAKCLSTFLKRCKNIFAHLQKMFFVFKNIFRDKNPKL